MPPGGGCAARRPHGSADVRAASDPSDVRPHGSGARMGPACGIRPGAGVSLAAATPDGTAAPTDNESGRPPSRGASAAPTPAVERAPPRAVASGTPSHATCCTSQTRSWAFPSGLTSDGKCMAVGVRSSFHRRCRGCRCKWRQCHHQLTQLATNQLTPRRQQLRRQRTRPGRWPSISAQREENPWRSARAASEGPALSCSFN